MSESAFSRLALIVAVAVGAHGTTVLIRYLSRRVVRARLRSEAKARTITGFLTSIVVFSIWFAAFGFVLSELGVSLATYFASASVIGLAVSFGSQGVVQDMITGLTVVFSDLIDVGDMVDIGGQVGIVEAVGMRFTVLINFSGAHVFVPNRNISNVINYPKGYVRAYLDARVPADEARVGEAERALRSIASAAHDQFPGILLLPPTYEGRIRPSGGAPLMRIKFRVWPGQGAVIEGPIKAAVVQALKALDPDYADWMVTVHYRAEPMTDEPDRRLPRPFAVERRSVPPGR
ncbi:MAG: mechanosensitive ion channel [Myxococcota bacterium]|nr:mechanosensitive ion channel [Myxococcales bacterium]